MGNCCGGETDNVVVAQQQQQQSGRGGSKTYGSGTTRKFQGDGHRLGTADEAQRLSTNPISNTTKMDRDDIPEPVYDHNLSSSDRNRIRAERAAAAEARLKKQGGGGNKKLPKKPKSSSSDAPLTGPHSKPLMTWTAG
mmetsp:Transcript_28060/g.42997  ORF Transcript_28060/g.42997 Transcript_28060/m.42997 type:complete len:138 (+) Transcript_28060:84-497(+)